MRERPFCIRCKEEFPVSEKAEKIQMGKLFRASQISPRIRRYLQETEGFAAKNWVCGNCCFDIIDILEDREG
jgi:hypothetical protein